MSSRRTPDGIDPHLTYTSPETPYCFGKFGHCRRSVKRTKKPIGTGKLDKTVTLKKWRDPGSNRGHHDFQAGFPHQFALPEKPIDMVNTL